ncbi:KilA protein [Desulfovibrio sp. DV]|uniref:KilA-N domain-containing protein n=1 Tax=Desulfovibrio sp. DV TaxID=1844708 RepID=UPI00094BC261|nr:KilA-N domain-containing protein [Desulfovibrio sp. DV]OLN29855.1 KilA protein [Desulfovibrio sp. DV]
MLKPAAPIFNLPAIRKPVQVQPVEQAPFKTLPAKFLIGDKLVATNADGLISLTDLWKAAGGELKDRPKNWIRSAGPRDFINHLAAKSGGPKTALIHVKHGVGTFAHWQIALAYAKWLSPELHMQVNEVFMRYKTGDATLAEEVIDKVAAIYLLKLFN